MAVKSHLPRENPPYLFVAPKMRDHLDVEEVFGVCNARKDRGGDDAEEEILGDWRGGEAGSQHA